MPLDDYFTNIGLQSMGAGAVRTGGAAADSFDPMSLLGNVGSGLSYAAGVLDKPGRAVRGTLAGKPRELLNIVPFSDKLGLTSQQDYTSGRDLLGNTRNTGSFLDEIPGLGAEILLDPLTYVGGIGLAGKAGKAGKAVRGLGLGDDITAAATKKFGRPVGRREALLSTTARDLPGRTQVNIRRMLGRDEFSRLRDDPLGGMFSLDIPGAGQVSTFGSGRASKGLARGLDTAGDYLKRGALALPEDASDLSKLIADTASGPVRGARMLFDTSVMGKLKATDQSVAERLFPAMKIARQETAGIAAKLEDEVNVAFKEFENYFGEGIGKLGDKATQNLSLRKAGLEGEDLVRTAFNKVIRLTAEIDYATAHRPVNNAISEVLPELANKTPENVLAKLEDASKAMVSAKDEAWRLAKSMGMHGEQLRNVMIRHFPRYINPDLMKKAGIHERRMLQTSSLASKMRDPRIRSIPGEIVNRIARDKSARGRNGVRHVLKNYDEYLQPEVLTDPVGGTTISKQAAAEGLVNFAEAHPGLLKYGQDLFPNSATDDVKRYLESVNSSIASIKSVHKLFGENFKDFGVPIKEAFAAAGLDVDEAAKFFDNMHGTGSSLKFVPKDIAEAVAATLKPAIDAEWAQELGNAIDRFTNVFKQHVTVPFPAFWVRNFTSGQYMNLVSGEIRTARDIAAYTKKFMEVEKYRRTGKLPLSLQRELEAHNVYSPHRQMVEGVQGHADERFVPKSALDIGGIARKSMAETAETPNLLLENIPGSKFARAAGRSVVETGSRASHSVEFMNRVPMYLYLRDVKKWSPAQAAKKTLELQVEWDDMTGFEKKVMKRLVPFYSFTRKIGPAQLRILLDRPGGAHGQTIRAMNVLRGDNDELVPDYISQQASIPIGGRSPEGMQKFITGLGLPQEDLFGMLAPGATSFKTMQGTLGELAGRINPLFKVPLELIAGKQLFSGRNLEDLSGVGSDILYNAGVTDERIQTPLLLEQALSNSPIARYLSTARTALDPRKSTAGLAVQLGTGVRTTDVDMPKAARTKKRDLIEDILRQSPRISHFNRIFPKKGAELTEIERLLMEIYKE